MLLIGQPNWVFFFLFYISFIFQLPRITIFISFLFFSLILSFAFLRSPTPPPGNVRTENIVFSKIYYKKKKYDWKRISSASRHLPTSHGKVLNVCCNFFFVKAVLLENAQDHLQINRMLKEEYYKIAQHINNNKLGTHTPK